MSNEGKKVTSKKTMAAIGRFSYFRKVRSGTSRLFSKAALCFLIVLVTTLLLPSWSPSYAKSDEHDLTKTMDKNKNKIDDVLEAKEGLSDIIIRFDDSSSSSAKASSLTKDHGFKKVETFQTFNWVGIPGVTKEKIHELSKRSDIELIEFSPIFNVTLDTAAKSARAKASPLYSPHTAQDLGLTGAGVNICIIDTGVDDTIHESLVGKFVAGYNAISDTVSNPDDDHFHGTHVAGIALGTGGPSKTYRGTAPGAGLVDVKVLNSGGSGWAWDIIQGIDWCKANKNAYNIKIMSISLGGGYGSGTDATSVAVNSAVDAGIVVVVAAGNAGPNYNTINSPGTADKAITVGNVYDFNTIDPSDDTVSSSSSRGVRPSDGDSNLLDELKPDVSAPGTSIISAQFNSASGYWSLSGTSMATPLVAGIVALLLEYDSTLTPAQVKTWLINTAQDKNGTYNPTLSSKYDRDYGWGEARFLLFTAKTDKTAYSAGETVSVSGKIFPGDVANAISIEVRNPNAEVHLSDQIVASADGSYLYEFDLGSVAIGGKYKVIVSYAQASIEGTFTYSSIKTTDFNGDGYPDLAIGVPSEDVGTIPDAGAVNVMYGSKSGLTAQANKMWHQNSASVLDDAEAGDSFGTALASADFNGDGFADLAVGVNGEDISSSSGIIQNAGAVSVLYGSSIGLNANNDQFWHQNKDGLKSQDPAQPHDNFGGALTAGDFNGDGFADLAIGAYGDNVDNISTAGVVNVLYGSSAGLVAKNNQLWHQNKAGVSDSSETQDFFGQTLTSGDFNGDSYSDLAIGVPFENVGTIADAGSVNILYGSSARLTSTSNQLLSLPSPVAADYFGLALAAGDFNNDLYSDLAIGAPYRDISGISAAGMVNVRYGLSTGLVTLGMQNWDQSSTDVEGDPEVGDLFGDTLAAGDYNGDGYSDLAISHPLEETGFFSYDEGAINVLYGASGAGLSAAGDQYWDQDNTVDVSEDYDRFGESLSPGDYNADGYTDLAIGVPFEDVKLPSGSSVQDAGAVNVMYGSKTGIATVGNQYLHQDYPLVEDLVEIGDLFGYAVAGDVEVAPSAASVTEPEDVTSSDVKGSESN